MPTLGISSGSSPIAFYTDMNISDNNALEILEKLGSCTRIEEDQFDKPRWIDTSTMICDPLTKHGNDAFAQRLVNTMQTGRLDLKATAASEIKKMRQQKARMNKIPKVESDELEV